VRVPLTKRALLAALLVMPALVACQGGSDEASAAAVPTLGGVVPAPVEAVPASGADFVLNAQTAIQAAGDAKPVADELGAILRPATGFALPIREGAGPNAVALVLDGADQRVGEQGYQLDVATSGVVVRARTAAGLFAGVQTLRQLLPAEIEADAVQQKAWVVPGGKILDYPRFAYRGAMLDLARHFFGPDEVKRYIDQIVQYKVNHLHLHLTDDQGWRIEITKWPDLTTKGGGPGTGVGGTGPGFLTQAQYSDIVSYAADRYVTIVPEIDMPGHTNAAQATYGELNCDGKPVRPRTDTEVGYSSFCIDKEITYTFVEDVVRELAALTPGPYLHIGGDEADATSEAQYRTFLEKVLPLPAKYGKKTMGWHDIAAVAAPKDATITYWGTEVSDDSVAAHAAGGGKVIMSPANRTYLDMQYDSTTKLGLHWAGYIEVKDAYDWDPASRLPGVAESAIQGIEAPLWSETLNTGDDIEYMAFPRLAAVAELGWSAAATHSWDTFRTRLATQGPRWTRQGVDFYRSPQIPWAP
jgi:hexosaminidase